MLPLIESARHLFIRFELTILSSFLNNMSIILVLRNPTLEKLTLRLVLFSLLRCTCGGCFLFFVVPVVDD